MASKLKTRMKELKSKMEELREKNFLSAEEGKKLQHMEEEMNELKEKHKTYSKRGRGSRNKGSNYEREIAKVLGDFLDVEFKRTPLSGGFSKSSNMGAFKGDIICTNDDVDFALHSECKDQKSWQLKKWYEQARDEVTDSKIPAVIMKKPNTNNPGQKGNQQNLITLDLEDFLNIVDVDKLLGKQKSVKKVLRRK